MTQATSAWLIERLLAWYDASARKLPWRAAGGGPVSAYGVLVSEFMLQQTTVATVKSPFPGFPGALSRLPCARRRGRKRGSACLAGAWLLPPRPCAARLRPRHRAAPWRAAAERRSGAARPAGHRALHRERAAGDRSRRAERSGRRQRAACHGAPASGRDSSARCRRPPARSAPAVSPATIGRGSVAQALMDLGATVCRPRRPACLVCPWRPACQAHLAGLAERTAAARAQARATGAPRPRLSAGATGWRHPVSAPPVRRPSRRPARAALEPMAGRAAGDRAGARPRPVGGRPGACIRQRPVTASPISCSSSPSPKRAWTTPGRPRMPRARSGAGPRNSTGWRCRP